MWTGDEMVNNKEQGLMNDNDGTVEMYEVNDEGVILDDDDGVYSPSEVPAQGKASVPSTTINMMCNVIGGGVLALPTAFHDSSMIVGIIMLLGTTCITTMNLYFIVECAEFTKIYSYRMLLARGLGEHLSRVVDLALFVFPMGALITYCRVIADAMPPVMENVFHASGFWLNEICWLLIGGILFFALSCRRSLEELKLSSIFGLLTIFYAGFLVIFRFFDGSYNEEGRAATVAKDFDAFYFKKDLFKTIPIISFSLSVHNNAPSYYEELKDRTPAKMYKVIKYAHGGIVSTYTLIAVFGLLTFGDRIVEAKGDILDAYAKDDQLMNSARLLMFIHFACVYPILQMAARRGFNNLVFRTNDLKLSLLIVESFFIVLGTCILAAIIPNIDIVLSYNGALTGSIIIMMAPAGLYISIDPHAHHSNVKMKKGLAIFSIVFGTVVAITGVVVQTMDLVAKDDN